MTDLRLGALDDGLRGSLARIVDEFLRFVRQGGRTDTSPGRRRTGRTGTGCGGGRVLRAGAGVKRSCGAA
ncbi:hypothetical protein OHB14_18330 [Streptomyces sp. NBC_01613]|uniref:hypothetical protein n=1 Tax=Streptomyces sp. NBC_01613 TaxID=2975896 RepID=UPI00386D668E